MTLFGAFVISSFIVVEVFLVESVIDAFALLAACSFRRVFKRMAVDPVWCSFDGLTLVV